MIAAVEHIVAGLTLGSLSLMILILAAESVRAQVPYFFERVWWGFAVTVFLLLDVTIHDYGLDNNAWFEHIETWTIAGIGLLGTVVFGLTAWRVNRAAKKGERRDEH